MKLLICQPEIEITRSTEDINKNTDRIIELISKNYSKQTGLIILPELSTVSYDKDTFDKLEILSENTTGSTFEKFSVIAKELSSYIVFGIPRKEGQKYYISQILINSEGQYQDHYDKLHLAQFGDSVEKEYFSAGSEFCVFNINNIIFGLILCYDIRFPSLCSMMRKKYRVDVILHPCAFSKDVTFYSWHSFVITRALENLCYFISVNRAGENWGNSIICPPWVDGVMRPQILDEREQFIEYEIDKNLIDRKRIEFPFFDDESPHINN